MNLPNRGTPALRRGAGETAVVLRIKMRIVHHQLAHDFHLLPLEGVHFGEAPVWVKGGSCIGGHFRYHAGLVHSGGLPDYRLGLRLPNLVRERFVESQTNVKVKGIGSQQPAIASFAVGRVACARIFREVKVSNHGVDISFALAGKLVRKRSMIRRSQSAPAAGSPPGMFRKVRKLGFQVGKIAARQNSR